MLRKISGECASSQPPLAFRSPLRPPQGGTAQNNPRYQYLRYVSVNSAKVSSRIGYGHGQPCGLLNITYQILIAGTPPFHTPLWLSVSPIPYPPCRGEGDGGHGALWCGLYGRP